MKIRHAIEEDVSQIVPILMEIQELHVRLFPWKFISVSAEDLKNFLLDVLKDPNSKILVATKDEKIVAYARTLIKESTEHIFCKADKYIMLDQLCVLKEFQRQGIGKKLLKEVRELANNLGYQNLRLKVWNENKAAKKFYKSSGFKTLVRDMIW